MDLSTSAKAPNLSNKTPAELLALVDSYIKQHGPPTDSYDGEKNTLFGWTDDGKGVWILPASKANFGHFEDIAKTNPGLGQCELLRLAGAKFFADWRLSDRARAAKEAERVQVTSEDDGATD
jgi:hypothetical protein